MPWPAEINWDNITTGQMAQALSVLMKAVNQRREVDTYTSAVDFWYMDGNIPNQKPYPSKTDLAGIGLYHKTGANAGLCVRELLHDIREEIEAMLIIGNGGFIVSLGSSTKYTASTLWASVGLGEPPDEENLDIMESINWKRLKEALDILVLFERTYTYWDIGNNYKSKQVQYDEEFLVSFQPYPPLFTYDRSYYPELQFDLAKSEIPSP